MDDTDLHLTMTDVSDEDGDMLREVSLVDGDKLMIFGHDMGPGVQHAFGMDEYEFSRGFTAGETAELADLLGAVVGVDLLEVIGERFASTQDIGTFAKENWIPGELTTWLHSSSNS